MSLLSIAVGGGFFVGLILAICGSLPKIEKKPFRETFLGKTLRNLLLDSRLYEKIGSNAEGLRAAALSITFLNILTGFGNGLYIMGVDTIKDVGTIMKKDIARSILLDGVLPFDNTLIGTIATFIGIGIVKWLILSAIFHFILTRIAFKSSRFETTARIAAFAYSPIALQVFMPLVFFNQSNFTSLWPLALFLVSNIWMGIILLFAIRKAWDINTSQSLGITILGGTIYYTFNSLLIEPTFPLQGIWFVIQPIELVEAILSAGIIIAILLGVFQKPQC